MKTKHTDDDYQRAILIITTMKELGVWKENTHLPEEKYLHLWDTLLELQHRTRND